MDNLEVIRCQFCRQEHEVNHSDLGSMFCRCQRIKPDINKQIEIVKQVAREIIEKQRKKNDLAN